MNPVHLGALALMGGFSGIIARRKGYGFFPWCLAIYPPVIGLIPLLALPNLAIGGYDAAELAALRIRGRTMGFIFVAILVLTICYSMAAPMRGGVAAGR